MTHCSAPCRASLVHHDVWGGPPLGPEGPGGKGYQTVWEELLPLSHIMGCLEESQSDLTGSESVQVFASLFSFEAELH